VSGILNLATRNQHVSKNLNILGKKQATVLVNIDVTENGTELNSVIPIIQKKIKSSIILADFFDSQNDSHIKTEKLSMLTNKIKKGFLILLVFGTSFKRDEIQHLAKTIILTGKQYY
jgi:hypothetical protein